ncbi:MAG: hypothetical protein L0H59_17515 [Tomitella sp.]|nr:hypothetical protein [Tomitella sp.]
MAEVNDVLSQVFVIGGLLVYAAGAAAVLLTNRVHRMPRLWAGWSDATRRQRRFQALDALSATTVFFLGVAAGSVGVSHGDDGVMVEPMTAGWWTIAGLLVVLLVLAAAKAALFPWGRRLNAFGYLAMAAGFMGFAAGVTAAGMSWGLVIAGLSVVGMELLVRFGMPAPGGEDDATATEAGRFGR